MPEQYVWATWSAAFLVPWVVLYATFPVQRRVIRWASLFTMPFGLTEPLFVPEYWSPPSLFDLARRTGFDIESLIFCFGIGGVGAALYNVLTGKRVVPVNPRERHEPLHRHHYKALAAPFVVFPALYFLPWNPIYPGILAMFTGAIANVLCRPELKLKTWVGGGLFLVYYALFLFALEASAPGYIERVWNLDALSGFVVLGLPIEELLFAVGFGMYWSGVYEHFTWTRAVGGVVVGR
ncbi:MAG: hypothetical protein GWN84_16265 [Gammaproteobacteria bacterium]|nr:hypothetical protein [Gammaproteobacteria bacterium]NIR84344.1 hypothetical protein [Gammaproteobacteria bacterium]NIR89860.1 hypothetical protein [Gammaproteobacteria bacterium]NIU05727.1 hypothetical protein [Gammaproteobacteria bacterium]NIV52487.1 hypothetical protein [Gammaproteobacteria bacterium]